MSIESRLIVLNFSRGKHNDLFQGNKFFHLEYCTAQRPIVYEES
jgi:hypothetical protein